MRNFERHSVHYGAEHVDFVVSFRAHPVNVVFTRLCGLIPLDVLGLAAPRTLTASHRVLVFRAVWGFLIACATSAARKPRPNLEARGTRFDRRPWIRKTRLEIRPRLKHEPEKWGEKPLQKSSAVRRILLAKLLFLSQTFIHQADQIIEAAALIKNSDNTRVIDSRFQCVRIRCE